MLNNASTRDTQSAALGVDAFMVPAFAFGLWGPAASCSTEWNTKLREGYATLGAEWQQFVSGRLQDDVSLMQQIASLRSPEQAWTAYIKFWQKAAEDYSREFATMSRLTGDLLSSGVAAAQHSTHAPASASQAAAKAA